MKEWTTLGNSEYFLAAAPESETERLSQKKKKTSEGKRLKSEHISDKYSKKFQNTKVTFPEEGIVHYFIEMGPLAEMRRMCI